MALDEGAPIAGLEVFDTHAFEKKLRRFGSAGLSQLHTVFDFDLTLTTSPADGRRVSSWGILEQHLTPEARKKSLDLFHHYYPIEQSGKMTLEEAETWWAQALAIQRESRVNLLEVEANFMELSTIRDETKNLFDFLKRINVPSVILSAGVKNVIDIWCSAYGIAPELVLATVFNTDDSGYMTGWDESTVIHVFNKAETGHPDLERIRTERPNVILVGDNINDADMASGDENVIRVRIVDTGVTSTDDDATVRHSTAERFDAMIKDGDMKPLMALIERIAHYTDVE